VIPGEPETREDDFMLRFVRAPNPACLPDQWFAVPDDFDYQGPQA
jgi:hypothetical protein